MQDDANRLKQALAEGRIQIGLWLAMASPTAAEIAAAAGYDWCVIDGEHGPNDIPMILAQLRAMAGGGAEPVVRVPAGEPWIIKQVLDLGARSLIVPMVDTPEEAEEMVRATRYAPEGMRGQAAPIVRASGYGARRDYVQAANREICLIVQAETARAMENIGAIAAVEGVDCVFIGPADLSCDMGHPGNPDAPEVRAAIAEGAAAIRAAGKAAGIIPAGAADFPALAAAGFSFIGGGADVVLLAEGMRGLARDMRAALGI